MWCRYVGVGWCRYCNVGVGMVRVSGKRGRLARTPLQGGPCKFSMFDTFRLLFGHCDKKFPLFENVTDVRGSWHLLQNVMKAQYNPSQFRAFRETATARAFYAQFYAKPFLLPGHRAVMPIPRLSVLFTEGTLAVLRGCLGTFLGEASTAGANPGCTYGSSATPVNVFDESDGTKTLKGELFHFCLRDEAAHSSATTYGRHEAMRRKTLQHGGD